MLPSVIGEIGSLVMACSPIALRRTAPDQGRGRLLAVGRSLQTAEVGLIEQSADHVFRDLPRVIVVKFDGVRELQSRIEPGRCVLVDAWRARCHSKDEPAR